MPKHRKKTVSFYRWCITGKQRNHCTKKKANYSPLNGIKALCSIGYTIHGTYIKLQIKSALVIRLIFHFHSIYRATCLKNINNSKGYPPIWIFLDKLLNHHILFVNKLNCNTKVYLSGLLQGWKVKCNKCKPDAHAADTNSKIREPGRQACTHGFATPNPGL